MSAPLSQGVTPVYGLRYVIQGQSARDTRKYLEENAKSIEAALLLGGVAAPGASDLLQVSGRVSTLEADAAARPVAMLRGSGTLSLTNNVPAALPLALEDVDPLGGHSTTVNTSRWTCPAGWAGTYLVMAGVRIDGGSTGWRTASIRKNGAGLVGNKGINSEQQNAAGAAFVTIAPTLVALAGGEYLELFATQDSGAALNANLNNSWLDLLRVLPA